MTEINVVGYELKAENIQDFDSFQEELLNSPFTSAKDVLESTYQTPFVRLDDREIDDLTREATITTLEGIGKPIHSVRVVNPVTGEGSYVFMAVTGSEREDGTVWPNPMAGLSEEAKSYLMLELVQVPMSPVLQIASEMFLEAPDFDFR